MEVSDQAVWSASLTGLMRFDRSNGELETFDKTNGLSDVLIREMAWNSEVNVLIVGYGNSNIDLIDDFGNVINLPDVLNSSLTGSKLINDIYTQGTNAYLSSDFGIIVLDLINLEIKATYIIGDNGQSVACYDFSQAEDTLYAVTQEGLKYAFLDGSNLLDFQSWSTVNASITEGIEHWNNSCFVHSLDSVYQLYSLDSLIPLMPLNGYEEVYLASSDSLYLVQTEGDLVSGIVDSSQILVWRTLDLNFDSAVYPLTLWI